MIGNDIKYEMDRLGMALPALASAQAMLHHPVACRCREQHIILYTTCSILQ